MSSPGGQYKFPSMVLCEGKKDSILFKYIQDHLNKPHLHIASSGGNTKFVDKLKAMKTARGFSNVKHILLVSDNDDVHTDSFAAVCAQIVAAGYEAPPTPGVAGLGSPSFTVLMVPIDGSPGNMETVCEPAARTVAPKTAPIIDEFMARLNSDNWSAGRKSKAWLRAFLAAVCARDPFIAFGDSFDPAEHLLDVKHPAFKPILDEIAKLP